MPVFYASLAHAVAVGQLSGDIMIMKEMNRRLFLQGSGSVASSSMLKAGLPAFIAASQAACSAKQQAAAFENISQAEAREIIALAARILPTTDTPGATEAGAVYFFDKAFGTFFADNIATAREQLADFQSGITDQYPGAQQFSDLDEADQDAYLKANENTQFFFFARFLTLAGVFAMSSHGGNKNDIGWKLVGMDGPPHAWAPPFGHYDAEYLEEQQNGE
jgi:gluconate 2-dehydrogenase gamma chain